MKKGGLHRLCFPHPMLAEGVRSATGHCTGHRGVRGLRRSLPASLPRTTLGPAQAAVPPRAPWRKPRRRREGVKGGKESKSHSRSFPSAANSTVPRFAPNPVDKDSALLYFVCRSIALRTSVSIMVSLVRPEEMIVGSDPNKSKEMIYERII